MKLGIHAFAWTNHWSNASLDLIDRAASLGMDFIEIPLLSIDDVDPAAIRARLQAADIDVVTSTTLSEGRDLTSEDAETRRAGVDYLFRCVDATAAMGASQLSGVIYSWHGKHPENRPEARHWHYATDALRLVADHAAARGVSVALEPVNRYETCLVNTCEQAIYLAGLIDRPNIRIHLDTYHMNIEEKGWAGPVRAAGPLLAHIHLCENDRGIPGTGLVDWEALFAALGELHYDGYAALESFIDVSDDMRAATFVWRDTAPSGDQLVREGWAFLRGLAERHGLATAAR